MVLEGALHLHSVGADRSSEDGESRDREAELRVEAASAAEDEGLQREGEADWRGMAGEIDWGVFAVSE